MTECNEKIAQICGLIREGLNTMTECKEHEDSGGYYKALHDLHELLDRMGEPMDRLEARADLARLGL